MASSGRLQAAAKIFLTAARFSQLLGRKLASEDIEMSGEEDRLAQSSHKVKDPWWEESEQWMSRRVDFLSMSTA